MSTMEAENSEARLKDMPSCKCRSAAITIVASVHTRTLVGEHDVHGEEGGAAEGHAALPRCQLHCEAARLEQRKHAAIALVPAAIGMYAVSKRRFDVGPCT